MIHELYVRERLRFPAAPCLVFEDSPNGLAAARAAGLRTVITINDYTRDHDFDGAAIVLDSLGEPDAPCRVLSGASANGMRLFDLAAARAVHAA